MDGFEIAVRHGSANRFTIVVTGMQPYQPHYIMIGGRREDRIPPMLMADGIGMGSHTFVTHSLRPVGFEVGVVDPGGSSPPPRYAIMFPRLRPGRKRPFGR